MRFPFHPPHIYPCLSAGKYEELPSASPQLDLKLHFLTNIYTPFAITRPRRTLKKGNAATRLFRCRNQTFGNFSVLSTRRYLCFSLLSNRTTQRTAKGRTVSYMLRNIRIHMEKTLISKSLPRTWHSKETLCKSTKGWFILYLFCSCFFIIFSLQTQNFLTIALRGAHLRECANTKRTPYLNIMPVVHNRYKWTRYLEITLTTVHDRNINRSSKK